MQATTLTLTLTFVTVATQIGLAARLISPTTSASLLTAGLVSAALFPAVALRLLVPAERVPESIRLKDTGLDRRLPRGLADR
jgi:multidrug efflux pump subunit AcrB